MTNRETLSLKPFRFSFSNVLDWSGSGVSPNFENKILTFYKDTKSFFDEKCV
jgi:hypothetical protein